MRPLLPLLALAAACNGNGALGGNASWTDWGPPWTTSAQYRALAAADLESLDEGFDTGADLGEQRYATIEESGTQVVWSVFADESLSQLLFSFTFEASGGLLLTDSSAGSYDPPVVILPETVRSGDSEKTGDFKVSTNRMPTVNTWYGQFTDVVQADISGPATDAATGQIRFAKGVGPIQFVLSGETGDLSWYR